ncbi:MAG: nucleoside deaminase [Paludibacteraceae bacterium]|nr:nucleoside deaminase [Paludibacteraceae bacterium]MEE1173877.1 nucleoside deaminase [Paludibacteraceae bacterium]
MMDDTYYMKQALIEAKKAFDADEVPVGAVAVVGGRIIGRGHNLTETLNDATAHAEMMALTAAMNELGAKYLPECTLYVTVEPCVMCAGAMYWAKIARLVYGASEEKYGFTVKAPTSLHPKTEVVAGVMQEECAQLMKDFFKAKR